MGLSIHYNGRFKTSASLTEMIDEVRDIAEINKWKYEINNTKFPKKLYDDNSYNNKIYGISFTPPKSEPIFLTFLSNRRMCSYHSLKLWGKSTEEEFKKHLYMLSTKTQYAGREVHKIIIHLLKYLSKKYLGEFTLYDEGHYWETEGDEVLNRNFEKYEELIDSFGFALDTIPMNRDETIQDYLHRIAQIVSNRNNK
jgi:hypothetical protein